MYLHGIETERLKFKKLELTDAKIWELFFKNNPSLDFLGLEKSLDEKAQSQDWIEKQLLRYKNKRFGHHALIEKKTGKLIGQCGLLTQEVEGKTEIEVGYHILPEHWGKGFATEAAVKVKNYAFENAICNTLISIIDIRNSASQHVADKIGMKKGKQIKLYGLDVFLYRLNNE